MSVAVYDISTGALISVASSLALVANPLPSGLAVKDVGVIPYGYVWDATLLVFVAPPNPTIIYKLEFIRRFTDAEKKAFFTFSTNTTLTATQRDNVQAFYRYLDFLDRVDLTETAVNTGVHYLENIGLLATGRAAQILA